jgi:uncharacterized protein
MATAAIQGQIQEDMKAAMRSQDKERLATIRLIMAALKQREVDERIVLTDEQILVTLDKMLKQRRQSIDEFQKGGREDLVKKEVDEMKIIQQYLPEQLSAEEINSLIQTIIKETGATSAKDMGKVMAAVKPKLQGRADMSAVSTLVKELLGS